MSAFWRVHEGLIPTKAEEREALAPLLGERSLLPEIDEWGDPVFEYLWPTDAPIAPADVTPPAAQSPIVVSRPASRPIDRRPPPPVAAPARVVAAEPPKHAPNPIETALTLHGRMVALGGERFLCSPDVAANLPDDLAVLRRIFDGFALQVDATLPVNTLRRVQS